MQRVYIARMPGNKYSVDPMSFILRPRRPTRRRLMFESHVLRPISQSAHIMKQATKAATNIQKSQRRSSSQKQTQKRRIATAAKNKVKSPSKLRKPLWKNMPKHLQNSLRVKSLGLPADIERKILRLL